MPTRNNWSEEETVLAFYYYCQIPFGKIHHGNPEIIRISRMIGRSPSAVARKMCNLAHFDPSLQERNIVGLAHASRLDKIIAEQYINDWENLAMKAKSIEAGLLGKKVEEFVNVEDELPEGRDRDRIVALRVNQDFFRGAVLSSYGYHCCVTGIANTELLIASHIKPWKVADTKTERTNPCNGLCLNALHDKAFDRGLMTVLPDYTIRISSRLTGDGEGTRWIKSFDKRFIVLPQRFLPSREFLEYHNDVVFVP